MNKKHNPQQLLHLKVDVRQQSLKSEQTCYMFSPQLKPHVLTEVAEARQRKPTGESAGPQLGQLLLSWSP